MATLRMFDLFEEEAQRRPKQLTIRHRQWIRNLLEEVVGTEESSNVHNLISTHLSLKDVEFMHCSLEQNDNKWLKVNVHLGEWAGNETNTKRTWYEFKQRFPSNPLPENHDQPR
jgi:hypothetical protein